MRREDEAGVALALAIIVVVVIGAMGAGLLLVVREGLEADIAAANARRALYAAESGTRLAARHILSDPRTSAYDDAIPDSAPPDCEPPPADEAVADTAWSYAGGGRAGTLSGADVEAGIVSLGEGCGLSEPEAGKRYFGVYSEGGFRDARRFVAAVYETTDSGAPLAVYGAKNVALGGSSSVSGGSVFAGEDVEIESGASVSGRDLAYGDWSAGGSTPRSETDGAVAAAGRVYGETAAPIYDSETVPAFSPQKASGRLTFPFDPGFWSAERFAFVKEAAADQGSSYEGGDIAGWPENATDSTVVYVGANGADGSGGEVVLDAGACGEVCRGTLVSEGDVRITGARFEGVILSAGDIVVEEGASVRGAVVATGNLYLDGEVAGAGQELRLRPGHFGVEVYDWREPFAGAGR